MMKGGRALDIAARHSRILFGEYSGRRDVEMVRLNAAELPPDDDDKTGMLSEEELREAASPPPNDALPEGSMLGQYVVEKVIGGGGGGIVYWRAIACSVATSPSRCCARRWPRFPAW
jgi:hypothetical protein